MIVDFWKYQATGNDFVMIDGTNGLQLNQEQIQFLCDRHFGIGSDGVLIIRKSDNYDFRMEFFNPDGSQASFCGNGGRCIAVFASKILNLGANIKFIAKDGVHTANINGSVVELKMKDVNVIKKYNDLYYLDTGTHHTVIFKNPSKVYAKKIRYDERFAPEGTNVNFVQELAEDKIFVKTYEKGVENFTLSCGTGVVAAALAFALKNNIEKKILVATDGGFLTVDFKTNGKTFSNVILAGEAQEVFYGKIEI